MQMINQLKEENEALKKQQSARQYVTIPQKPAPAREQDDDLMNQLNEIASEQQRVSQSRGSARLQTPGHANQGVLRQ